MKLTSAPPSAVSLVCAGQAARIELLFLRAECKFCALIIPILSEEGRKEGRGALSDGQTAAGERAGVKSFHVKSRVGANAEICDSGAAATLADQFCIFGYKD